MTRSVIFVFLLFATGLHPQQQVTDFDAHLDALNYHFNRFARAYWGCPPGATEIKQCDPKVGTWKADEFDKASAEARHVFRLKER